MLKIFFSIFDKNVTNVTTSIFLMAFKKVNLDS